MAQQDAFPVLRRSFKLLEVMGLRHTGMTFNEISTLFPDAPASSVSRLLKALQDEQIISKNEESRFYLLGERAVQLGRKLRGQISYTELLRPLVDQLAREVGHSSVFFKMADDHFELVVKHEVTNGFHYMTEGQSNFNFATHGAGMTLMAYLPEADRDRLWKLSVQKHPSHPNKADYYARMEQIKVDGFYLSRTDERDYFTRVMAPVFRGEQFVGALGISMLGLQAEDVQFFEPLIQTVKETAAHATKILSRF
jgi:DNA-binding IclR family transcriptional regulator